MLNEFVFVASVYGEVNWIGGSNPGPLQVTVGVFLLMWGTKICELRLERRSVRRNARPGMHEALG